MVECQTAQFLAQNQPMTYNDLQTLIYRSESDSWLYNDTLGIFTYESDLNVTIRVQRDEEQDFVEDWTKRVPDKNAKRVAFDLFYSASFVERVYLVGVDGFRAYVPIPDITSKVITRAKYQFAKAVDHTGTFDDYIKRCGLTVE